MIKKIFFIFIFFLFTNDLVAENNIMILKLKDGNVEIELFEDIAPNHVKRFKQLSSEKLYDGVVGAGKAVGGVVKKVLEPANNSPEAQRERMGARRPQNAQQQGVANKTAEVMKNSADLFDIVKGHLIDEGLTEEEALKKMLTLTDEERSEIIEGSCGSKKDKKKKGGYGK